MIWLGLVLLKIQSAKCLLIGFKFLLENICSDLPQFFNLCYFNSRFLSADFLLVIVFFEDIPESNLSFIDIMLSAASLLL